MTKEQAQVAEWMALFGQQGPSVPTMPGDRTVDLRLRLIDEELTELEKGFILQDIVEISDALADLMYVVLGTAVACGIDLEPIFQEVHRSNMTKQWADEPHVRKTHIGKVIKPPTYTPPNIAPLIALQR